VPASTFVQKGLPLWTTKATIKVVQQQKEQGFCPPDILRRGEQRDHDQRNPRVARAPTSGMLVATC
jgi:hypothetical protein